MYNHVYVSVLHSDKNKKIWRKIKNFLLLRESRIHFIEYYATININVLLLSKMTGDISKKYFLFRKARCKSIYIITIFKSNDKSLNSICVSMRK
jgi:2-phosphoglycerate kinase